MTTAHDFEFTTLKGEPLPMNSFEGKAVLVGRGGEALAAFSPRTLPTDPKIRSAIEAAH